MLRSSLPFRAPGWSLLWQPTQLATRIGAMSCENLSPPESAVLVLAGLRVGLLARRLLGEPRLLAGRLRPAAPGERHVRCRRPASWPNGSTPPGSWPSWTGNCAAAGRIGPNPDGIPGTHRPSHSPARKSTPARLSPRHRMLRDMMLPPLACRNLDDPIFLLFLALRTLTSLAAAIREDPDPTARPIRAELRAGYAADDYSVPSGRRDAGHDACIEASVRSRRLVAFSDREGGISSSYISSSAGFPSDIHSIAVSSRQVGRSAWVLASVIHSTYSRLLAAGSSSSKVECTAGSFPRALATSSGTTRAGFGCLGFRAQERCLDPGLVELHGLLDVAGQGVLRGQVREPW